MGQILITKQEGPVRAMLTNDPYHIAKRREYDAEYETPLGVSHDVTVGDCECLMHLVGFDNEDVLRTDRQQAIAVFKRFMAEFECGDITGTLNSLK